MKLRDERNMGDHISTMELGLLRLTSMGSEIDGSLEIAIMKQSLSNLKEYAFKKTFIDTMENELAT